MVGQGLVSNEARDVAREIEDSLEARDIRGIGLLALAGATGVIISQEITERVLPLLNMPREPSSPTEFLAAAGVKVAYALLLGVVAASLSGVALVAVAFHAVGAVVFAGADLLNAAQRSGFLGEGTRTAAPSGGSGKSQPPGQRSSGGGMTGSSTVGGNGSVGGAWHA